MASGVKGFGIWKSSTWAETPGLPTQVKEEGVRGDFSPDGRTLAVPVGEQIFYLDATSFATKAVLAHNVAASPKYRIRFSRTGRFLATQGSDCNVRIWDLETLRAQLAELKLAWE